jgi:hypothetical protein
LTVKFSLHLNFCRYFFLFVFDSYLLLVCLSLFFKQFWLLNFWTFLAFFDFSSLECCSIVSLSELFEVVHSLLVNFLYFVHNIVIILNHLSFACEFLRSILHLFQCFLINLLILLLSSLFALISPVFISFLFLLLESKAFQTSILQNCFVILSIAFNCASYGSFSWVTSILRFSIMYFFEWITWHLHNYRGSTRILKSFFLFFLFLNELNELFSNV